MSKPSGRQRMLVRYVAMFTALVKGVNALLQTVSLALRLIHSMVR
jgi:hypothetical protein